MDDKRNLIVNDPQEIDRVRERAAGELNQVRKQKIRLECYTDRLEKENKILRASATNESLATAWKFEDSERENFVLCDEIIQLKSEIEQLKMEIERMTAAYLPTEAKMSRLERALDGANKEIKTMRSLAYSMLDNHSLP